ncbi:MAG: fructose PTS transporter subunit IIA [Candidatus Izemoplasma sp.]|nr:fructose PTS transporter subunit IIA [Candidatus Izemoplasma sp.]
MKIVDLITKDIITLELSSSTKQDVIQELAELLKSDDRISDLDKFVEEVNKREALGSTGVGYGVAIPHAKTKYVKRSSLVFGRTNEGFDYDSLDGKETDLFFMIAVPEGGENLHLRTLAKLSRGLMDETFREELRNAKTKEALIHTLSQIDKEEAK